MERLSTWVKCPAGHVNLRESALKEAEVVGSNFLTCPQCGRVAKPTETPKIGVDRS